MEYLPTLPAKNTDKELIDVVNRVITENRPYTFPWCDVGKTIDEFHAESKKYPEEMKKVHIYFENNWANSGVTVLPLSYVS